MRKGEEEMKCSWCNGTGKFKEPKDMKLYDKEFDRLDAPGSLTMGECRERALEYAGYTIIDCPKCGGSGEE